MATPVTLQDVEQVLHPWLGTLFLSSTPFASKLAFQLQEYAPYRQTLEELRDQVESYVVTELNRLTGGSMRMVLDDFQAKRIGLRDVLWMTDDIMGVLFDRLTLLSVNYEKLNDYALRVESLSALRVLYQKYASFFTQEEFHFLIQTIRRLYPPERYAAWLETDEKK